MKQIGKSWCPVVTGALMVLFIAFPLSAGEIAVSAVLQNPAQYDGRTVTLRGTLAMLKEVISSRGNDYATFELQDAEGRAVRVFVWGRPHLKEGERVEVVGIFRHVKHVGQYAFHDEIDAQSITATH